MTVPATSLPQIPEAMSPVIRTKHTEEAVKAPPPPPPVKSGMSGGELGGRQPSTPPEGFLTSLWRLRSRGRYKLFLALTLRLGMIYLFGSSTEAKTTSTQSAIEPRQAAAGYLMEYTDRNDTSSYVHLHIDLPDIWSQDLINEGADLYGGMNSRSRILQICKDNPNCINDTPDREQNYFNGTRSSIGSKVAGKRAGYGGWFRVGGGALSTSVYILRHPNPESSSSVEVHFRSHNHLTTSSLDDEVDSRVDFRVNQREIGFGDNTPIVQPRKGDTELLVVTWDDIERYQPNEHGLIETDSSGTITATRLNADQRYIWDNSNDIGKVESIYWQYRIYYTHDHTLPYDLENHGCREDPSDPDNSPLSKDKCWNTEGLGWSGRVDIDNTNRRYQATINATGKYEPETQIWTVIRLTQHRQGQTLQLYSHPTRIFLPALMEVTSQPSSLQATWTNTYPHNINEYQYRIGHNEGGRQTDFSDWISMCSTDLEEDTSGGDTEVTATIRSVQSHPNSGTCGGDPSTALQNGTNYRVQVRAINRADAESPYVRNYVHAQMVSPQVGPPLQPQNLAANPTYDEIVLSWDEITSAETITQTQYRTGTTGQDGTITWTDWAAISTDTDTTVTITGLDPETHYTIELRAQNQNGDSPAGTVVATTQAAPTPSTTPTAQPVGGGAGAFPVPPSGNPSPPGGDQPEPNGTDDGFADTSESVHQTNIVQLADMGVTRGCNPPTNTRFCPDRAVTRAEMATFLTRAFDLNPTDQDPFTDTQGNVHRTNINRMAAAGISRGCNPPTNDRFCPDRAVTRAEMATFMTRVLELEEEGGEFDDTQGNVHATNIRRFAEAGITRGCNPPSNTRYCPDRAVTRAEMATFLVRSTALNNS